MCRLLATASLTPTTVHSLLGPDHPRVFRDMARLHDDGWGHAWIDASGQVVSERFAESGLHHPGLEVALTSLQTRAHLVHLRFATNGLARALNNTHPFCADGMSFAHNGSLVPPARLDPLIPDTIRVQGSTDSERYFALIRGELHAGATVEEAVVRTVRRIRELFPRSSLNALLLTPHQLIAVHASRNTASPWRELRARTPSIELPEAHDERYFRMHIQRTPAGVAVASSGMDVSGWEELPAESVIIVSLTTLSVSVHALEPARPLPVQHL